jgi:LCP family protein required for cell wall assembly
MSRYDDADEAGWQESRRGGRRRTGGPRRLTTGMVASRATAGLVALTLVCASLFIYVKYREIWDSIKRVDVSGDLKGARPPIDPNAMNILLIGSDTRHGKNGKIGGRVGIEGQRSDTVMVVHVAPGARAGVVLSFPRDSVVPVLSCTPEGHAPGQQEQPGVMEQINSTFSNGGPGCLWKTIEQTTHIHIDDFVQLSFLGFEKVVNNLGGVDICLPKAVDVPQSGLHLKAGKHHVWGREALAFWRTREGLGEGSDLQRIQRDQYLMASLVQGIERKGLLTSTTKMAEVVGIAARNMTTNISSASTMLRIAETVRQIRTKTVQFIEVPTGTYAGNANWVQWTDQASDLFSAIAHDTKVPKISKGGKKSAGTPVKLAVAKPAQVNVEVLNGSGAQGQAGAASTQLTGRGFHVVGVSSASNFNYSSSVIEYRGKRMLPAVRALKQAMGDVEVVHDSTVAPGTVNLILGSSFTALATTTSKAPTKGLTHTFGGITGTAKICRDNAAFAGPDGT